MLSEKKLFLFDIDGTVALGDVLLPGAAEFFQEIKERGGQFVFITNNSTKKQLRTTSKNSVRWVSQPILRIL